MNGYQVIQQIAERRRGLEAEPGSVYPTVQQLEDEGLVEGVETGDAACSSSPTRAGAHVVEHPDELAATWRAFEDAARSRRPEPGDLKPVIGQVMGACGRSSPAGTRQQRAEAAEILAETRRRLYGLLAEGDPE